MSITINTPIIHKSLAQLVLSITPSAYVFDNPNQQGTNLPAWFIVHREPVGVREHLHSRYWLEYHIDLYYMLDFNLPHLFDDYSSIADQLSEITEYLPIYGYEGVVTHFYERSWGMYMDALKFSFTLKFRVTKDTQPVETMQVIESLDVFLKNMNMRIVTFTNETYPEFDIPLPEPMAADKGDFIKLPYMSGAYEKDDETWIPDCWDIGEFGQNIQVNENMVANLEWKVAEIVTLVFTNTDYPEFDITLPDSVVIEKGTYYTLPILSGEYTDGGKVYEPNMWSIGGFGEAVIIDEDTEANLIWVEVQPPGPVYPQGQFTYGEMQTNPNKQVELNAIELDSADDELMVVTGRIFAHAEFINDEALDWVMSLNGLMTVDS